MASSSIVIVHLPQSIIYTWEIYKPPFKYYHSNRFCKIMNIFFFLNDQFDGPQNKKAISNFNIPMTMNMDKYQFQERRKQNNNNNNNNDQFDGPPNEDMYSGSSVGGVFSSKVSLHAYKVYRRNLGNQKFVHLSFT